MSSPTCTTCANCLREDVGYSNYTVEDTYIECMLQLNPNLVGRSNIAESDITAAAILDYAQQCESYLKGTPAWLDVDREFAIYDRNTREYIYPLHTYCDDTNRDVFAAWLIRQQLQGRRV